MGRRSILSESHSTCLCRFWRKSPACSAARSMAPGLPVVAWARYRLHCADLSRAGARTVDEEGHVGEEIGRQVLGDLA